MSLAGANRLNGMTTSQKLRSQIKGRVIEPGDAEYDEGRVVFVGGIDRRPAFIVRVADPVDIGCAIEFARAAGLELAVRSGGHSGAGYSVTDGGVVIDLRDMRAQEIDTEGKTSWAETGPVSYTHLTLPTKA